MKIISRVVLAAAVLLAGVTVLSADGDDDGSFNSGNPIPYLTNDVPSAEFIASAIADSIGKSLNLRGKEATATTTANEANYFQYASDLAETLSGLTPAEQNTIWYGS